MTQIPYEIICLPSKLDLNRSVKVKIINSNRYAIDIELTVLYKYAPNRSKMDDNDSTRPRKEIILTAYNVLCNILLLK